MWWLHLYLRETYDFGIVEVVDDGIGGTKYKFFPEFAKENLSLFAGLPFAKGESITEGDWSRELPATLTDNSQELDDESDDSEEEEEQYQQNTPNDDDDPNDDDNNEYADEENQSNKSTFATGSPAYFQSRRNQYFFGNTFDNHSWSAWLKTKLKSLGYPDDVIERICFHSLRYAFNVASQIAALHSPNQAAAQRAVSYIGGWCGGSRNQNEVYQTELSTSSFAANTLGSDSSGSGFNYSLLTFQNNNSFDDMHPLSSRKPDLQRRITASSLWRIDAAINDKYNSLGMSIKDLISLKEFKEKKYSNFYNSEVKQETVADWITYQTPVARNRAFVMNSIKSIESLPEFEEWIVKFLAIKNQSSFKFRRGKFGLIEANFLKKCVTPTGDNTIIKKLLRDGAFFRSLAVKINRKFPTLLISTVEIADKYKALKLPNASTLMELVWPTIGIAEPLGNGERKIRWTPKETSNLITYSKEYGRNWTTILKRHPSMFHGSRTYKQLQNKYKNLAKGETSIGGHIEFLFKEGEEEVEEPSAVAGAEVEVMLTPIPNPTGTGNNNRPIVTPDGSNIGGGGGSLEAAFEFEGGEKNGERGSISNLSGGFVTYCEVLE